MTPTVILTRPRTQSESFAAKLRALWDHPIEIIVSPLIEIVPIDAACPRADAVIFTSANGVLASERLGLPGGLTAWCVGSKTAELAEKAGFVPKSGPGDAARLVAAIIAAKPRGILAHIRGKHARGEVSARLNAAGIVCKDVVAYDQRALHLTKEAQSAMSAQNPVACPLFSPRTAAILNAEGPFHAPVHIIALSEAVESAVSSRTARHVTLAARPDGNAMLAATLDVLRGKSGCGSA